MKKILIMSLFYILSIILLACSKSPLENDPIIIEDSSEDNIDVSEQETNQDNQAEDNQTKLENSDQETDIEVDADTDLQETNEPFKGIVILEGMEEEVNYHTYQSEYGYQMAYDMDRFTVTSEDGIDTYMAENINPEIYPYVFINITRSEYTDGKKTELNGNLYVYDKDTDQTLSTNSPKDNIKLGDYDAVHFETIDGDKWNSLVKHVYIITLEKYYYIIETNYFLEASEGYGVRIKAMLDTIVIN